MTIIVEDGTNVPGANSFVTLAEFDDWLANNGKTVTGNKEPLLLRSFSFMRVLPWCKSHDQPFTVTESMKEAQCDIAASMNGGFDPLSVANRSLKRKKVDVLEKEWFGPGHGSSPAAQLRRLPYSNAMLAGLLCDSGANNFDLVR